MRRSRPVPLWQRLKTKAWRGAKELRWLLPKSEYDSPRVLFVVGSQRSGTTLLMRLFDGDVRARVFHEQSELNSPGEDRLRLRPLPEVHQILSRVRHPLVVAKPLVESQHIREILSGIAGSRALWMFRHYRDVVQSSVRRFSGQVKHLRPLVNRVPDDWRSEGISEETQRVIAGHFSESMTRHDAAALMWYARNALFFEQELSSHPAVLPCRYEDLVRNPRETLRSIYGFVGLTEPAANLEQVHADSLGLGKDVPLTPAVEELCCDLERRIEEVFGAKGEVPETSGAGQRRSEVSLREGKD